jgi:hypothetical protein
MGVIGVAPGIANPSFIPARLGEPNVVPRKTKLD